MTQKHAQMDEVHSGTSVMSPSDLRLHFGLGQVKQIDLIEVKWPSAQTIEKFTNIEANQFLTIKEGSGIIKAEKYTPKSPASAADSKTVAAPSAKPVKP